MRKVENERGYGERRGIYRRTKGRSECRGGGWRWNVDEDEKERKWLREVDMGEEKRR